MTYTSTRNPYLIITNTNIMEILKRITSYEQSLKLQQLGVNQNLDTGSYFFEKDSDSLSFCVSSCNIIVKGEATEEKENIDFITYDDITHKDFNSNDDFYAEELDVVKAFDGAQIDELLPVCVEGNYYLQMQYDPRLKTFGYFYYDTESQSHLLESSASTKFEAKINMLILLLENGDISFS